MDAIKIMTEIESLETLCPLTGLAKQQMAIVRNIVESDAIGDPLPDYRLRILADRWTPHSVYLSGPMSGLPENNAPAFHWMEAEIAPRVREVLNPARAPQGLSWAEHMALDLRMLATRATAILMLPGWRSSRGACLEYRAARAMGMRACEVQV
jgi:hypothetical protein